MRRDISILVVDAEQVLREVLLRILGMEGYAVDTAADGEEALEKLRLNRYHLLVCDIHLPRMNGFEMLRTVKHKYPDMAVIMMIAHGDSMAVKESLVLGADEYITKPFKSFEVNLVVERAYWRLLSTRKPAGAERP